MVSNDNPLVLDGTPEIPDTLRERLRQYLNVRAAGLSALRADGRAVMISTRFAETSQLHMVTQPMGARFQLTFADEPINYADFVPGAPHLISYLKDQGGNEQYRLHLHNLETGQANPISPTQSRTTSWRWSNTGERIAFNSNSRNKVDFDIYIAQRDDPSQQRVIAQPGGLSFATAWAPDDSALIIGQYRSVTDSSYLLYRFDTQTLTPITPTETPARYSNASFGADANTLFLTTQRDTEFLVLYHVDLATQTWTPLTQDIPWDVTSVATSTDGRQLAFIVNNDGYSELYVMDTKTRTRRRIPNLPRGVLGGLEFAREASVLGFHITTPAQPADVYTLDLATDALTRWTQSEVGGLDTNQFTEPSLIHYKSFDGLEIPAFYFKPPGEGPHPVLIAIHGGPESQSRPSFISIRQLMVNELGVAILVPNVRGSTGYGKTYVGLDNGKKRENSVKDIGALLDWIATQPDLDTKRVAVAGGSYGGYMVLASLVHYADRLVAGAETVGISNFVTFLENTKAYRRDLRRVEYGDERDPDMRAFLEDISPLRHADKIRSALFVAHGANDPRVPVGEAEQIVDKVRAQGNSVWYMLARNEGHGFRKKENRDTYTLLLLLFVEEYLVGKK